MRDFKFRAWNSKRSEMILLGDLTGANWDIKFIFKRYEIMQYTGLKDKNGVEIYEGDIVTDNSGEQYIVFYSYGGFRLIAKSDKSIQLSVMDMPTKYYEVIGNIYESPYLLAPMDDKQEVLNG